MAAPKKGKRSRYLRPAGDKCKKYYNPPFTIGNDEMQEIMRERKNAPLSILASPDKYLHGDEIIINIKNHHNCSYFVNRSVDPPILDIEYHLNEAFTRWIESPIEFYSGVWWWGVLYLDVTAHADIIRAAAGGRDIAPDRRVRISFREGDRYDEIYVPAGRWVSLDESTDAAVLGN